MNKKEKELWKLFKEWYLKEEKSESFELRDVFDEIQKNSSMKTI